jgi:hypothetical protein
MRIKILSFFLLLFFLVSLALDPIQVNIHKIINIIYAINSGGDELESSEGIVYEADNYYSAATNSYTHKHAKSIRGNHTEVYQTVRYGTSFAYTLTLDTKGYYTLILKFTDHSPPNAEPKAFDVTVNKMLIFQNIDIGKFVGEYTALDLSVPFYFSGTKIKFDESTKVPAPDKKLIVEFHAKSDNAKVSAVILMKGLLKVPPPPAKPPKTADFFERYGAYMLIFLLFAFIIGFGYWSSYDWLLAKYGPSKKEKLVSAIKKNAFADNTKQPVVQSSKKNKQKSKQP